MIQHRRFSSNCIIGNEATELLTAASGRSPGSRVGLPSDFRSNYGEQKVTGATCIVCPPEPGDYDRMADLAGQLGYPCIGDQIRMGALKCGTRTSTPSMLPGFRSSLRADDFLHLFAYDSRMNLGLPMAWVVRCKKCGCTINCRAIDPQIEHSQPDKAAPPPQDSVMGGLSLWPD